MRQKILKTGNSLAVTIPANFVKILGLKSGMEVGVKPDLSKGTLKCTFAGTGHLPLLTSKK